MKIVTFFCGVFLLSNVLTNAYGQGTGCPPLQPYIDPHTNAIVKNKETCITDNKINSSACWVGADNTCYFVGSPAECACINQKGGRFCNGRLGTGDEFNYCKWGNGNQLTGCDSWRLYQGHCTYPGFKITQSPPNVEDYCRLLGGEVHASDCTNYYDNFGKKSTCSLDDLWQNKCSSINKKASPALDSLPSEEKHL